MIYTQFCPADIENGVAVFPALGSRGRGAKQSFMHSFVSPTSKTAEPFSRHWDQGIGAQSYDLHPVLSRRHKKRLCRFWSLGYVFSDFH
jgi:hypothetical protein